MHTPGPWITCGFENLTVNDRDGNTIIACPGSSTGTRIEMKANARLIAAAPDLLEALIECEVLLDQFPLIKRRVKAAIAKAEGRD